MELFERLVLWVVGLSTAAFVLGGLWAICGLFIGIGIRAAQWVIAL
jgi:hypothetical protein